MELTDSHKRQGARPASIMENLMGLLRIRIKKGINLAVRDVSSSDPYVVVKMGKQVLLFLLLLLSVFIFSPPFFDLVLS